MTTYTSTPERARQTPAGARRQRIRDLEDLLARVEAQLAEERRALTRITTPRRLRANPAVVPPGTDSRHVRAWARAHGWPNLGQRGRIPLDAITAYAQAHTRGATP